MDWKTMLAYVTGSVDENRCCVSSNSSRKIVSYATRSKDASS
jgi:hypothetical protein